MAIDLNSEERSFLAAEHALGLLEGDELELARKLEREDPEFANEVASWLPRFEGMFEQWPDGKPSVGLERRVLAAAGIDAANDNGATPWKWATGVATAVAAALAIALVTPANLPPAPQPEPRAEPQPGPAMAVAFSIEDGAQTLPAMLDLARHEVRIPRGLEVPDGRVAQLWLIEGESAPQPIGLFAPSANGLAATVTVDRDIPAGSVLAISIEPPGGSPTGLPTGPVVATGEIRPI